MTSIRLATLDDLPAILAISNHYALTAAANFAVEPEPLSMWQETWRATNEMHPWLVAEESPPPSEGGGREGSAIPHQRGSSTHPPTPSLGGRGKAPSPPTPALRGRGSAILAFAKSSPWKGRCAYHWTAETSVYVHADHHGRGVGRSLYERLISIMRAQGWRTLLGGITQPNEPSIRLHEACGFRKVALLERVGWKFDRWWDVGYWELHLRGTTEAPATIRPVREALNELEASVRAGR